MDTTMRNHTLKQELIVLVTMEVVVEEEVEEVDVVEEVEVVVEEEEEEEEEVVVVEEEEEEEEVEVELGEMGVAVAVSLPGLGCRACLRMPPLELCSGISSV